MKTRHRFLVSLLSTLAFVSVTHAQELDEAEIIRASTETLLSIPEPPLGYAVSKHPLVAGDRLLGFQVQVMKEDAVSKVLIKVESRDLSEQEQRVAACKGYLNGFASGLTEAGFKVTAHNVPDLAKSDFDVPVVVDLAFANDEGTVILANRRMFFTAKGYDVTVIATDEDDLKLLSDWAAQVKPAS